MIHSGNKDQPVHLDSLNGAIENDFRFRKWTLTRTYEGPLESW